MGIVRFNYALSYHMLLHTGTIPARGKIDILITFTPTEYNTSVIELKVHVRVCVCEIIVSSSFSLLSFHLSWSCHSSTLVPYFAL